MRSLIIATVAVLIFGVGSLLVVYLASGDSGAARRSATPGVSGAPADPSVQAAPPATPAARPAPDLSRYSAAGPGEPPRPMEYAPTPPPPPPGSWEAVRPVARPSALGPLGAALRMGLQELEPRLTECFETAPGRGVRSTTEAARERSSGPTVLMLELETGSGDVRIVGAPVETLGASDDGAVACVQQVLQGRTFPAPGARSGARHRVLHPLMQ